MSNQDLAEDERRENSEQLPGGTTERRDNRPDRNLSDDELLERIQQEDEETFADLSKRYLKDVAAVVKAKGFLRRLRGMDAEDIAQEANIKLLEKLKKGEKIDNEAAYLKKKAKFICLDKIRSQTEETIPLEGDRQEKMSNHSPTQLRSIRRKEEMEIVKRLINALPEKKRRILSLYLSSFKPSEISQILTKITLTPQALKNLEKENIPAEIIKGLAAFCGKEFIAVSKSFIEPKTPQNFQNLEECFRHLYEVSLDNFVSAIAEIIGRTQAKKYHSIILKHIVEVPFTNTDISQIVFPVMKNQIKPSLEKEEIQDWFFCDVCGKENCENQVINM